MGEERREKAAHCHSTETSLQECVCVCACVLWMLLDLRMYHKVNHTTLSLPSYYKWSAYKAVFLLKL